MEEELRIQYPNLKERQLSSGRQYGKDVWNIENVGDGLLYFLDLNGHYPDHREINDFQFLPNVRTLQRNFGGVVKVREILNLPIPKDFTKGQVRSDLAAQLNIQGAAAEERFYNILIKKIHPLRVHEQKTIRPNQIRCDFYIYTDINSGIIIDIFVAKDMDSVKRIINIKADKYFGLRDPVYFVAVCEEATKDKIKKYLEGRTKSVYFDLFNYDDFIARMDELIVNKLHYIKL